MTMIPKNITGHDLEGFKELELGRESNRASGWIDSAKELERLRAVTDLAKAQADNYAESIKSDMLDAKVRKVSVVVDGTYATLSWSGGERKGAIDEAQLEAFLQSLPPAKRRSVESFRKPPVQFTQLRVNVKEVA